MIRGKPLLASVQPDHADGRRVHRHGRVGRRAQQQSRRHPWHRAGRERAADRHSLWPAAAARRELRADPPSRQADPVRRGHRPQLRADARQAAAESARHRGRSGLDRHHPADAPASRSFARVGEEAGRAVFSKARAHRARGRGGVLARSHGAAGRQRAHHTQYQGAACGDRAVSRSHPPHSRTARCCPASRPGSPPAIHRVTPTGCCSRAASACCCGATSSISRRCRWRGRTARWCSTSSRSSRAPRASACWIGRRRKALRSPARTCRSRASAR